MKKIAYLFVLSFALSVDFNVSSSLNSGYCSSYDFYDYSENPRTILTSENYLQNLLENILSFKNISQH